MHADAYTTDVDECASMMPCDKNAKCTNTDGSFSCSCNPGYIGNGKTCARFSKPIIYYHYIKISCVCPSVRHGGSAEVI